MLKHLLATFFFILSHMAMSQQEFRLSMKDSRMIIRGTSSLHDWQCKVEQGTGQAQVELDGMALQSVKAMTVAMIVNSIRSISENGEYYEKAMDKNVYKALNAEKFPSITFTLTKPTNFGKPGLHDAVGQLKISGTGREIPLAVRATASTNAIIFEGKVLLRMTDYNIEPPTALFGTIKTGNDVGIEFKLVFLPVK